ncbi:hypothetical protein [Paludisphaera rhizosphaerae]|uniref:hypothetical protein n=1 Tax=Paludisphaera rhizosphaerae TaxID=2711216 RepID=UPI0013ED744F|nr:hypothetical protein [Paludisphaera rhizosphaerae]
MTPTPGSWKAAAAAGLFAAGLALGWHAKGVSVQAAQAKALRARIAHSAELDQAALERSTKLEFDVAALRESRRAAVVAREKEIAKPVYSACPVPADGLRLLNDRVAAAPPAR